VTPEFKEKQVSTTHSRKRISFLILMKRNRKRGEEENEEEQKRMHIQGRAYDTSHGGSRAILK